MKKILHFWVAALLCGALWSCEYDDSGLWDKVNDLDERLEQLEATARSINSDLESLRKLVQAQQNKVTIDGVDPLDDGYRIRFSDGTTADISNGRDGNDAPVISIRKNGDGVWCWTLGGEFILVDGKPLHAEGLDGEPGAPGNSGAPGKDAVAPKIRINADTKEWEISVDGGKTWTSTGVVAEGKDGADGTDGDAVFDGVDSDSDPNWVLFTLGDGTVLRVAKTAAFDFVIEGVTGVERFVFGKSRSYRVTATGVVDWSISKADGWRAVYAGDELTVTAPAADNAYAELTGEIVVHVTSATGGCKIVKMQVEAQPYELRVLTFEDEDYKGPGNFLGNKDWSSLIDAQQYGGPLLYPTDGELYRWSDEGNTFLASEFPNEWGDCQYWGGGHAISNYVEPDLSNGDFQHQLSVYYRHPETGFGGHNGSKNFCVHYGYRDDSGFGGSLLPSIYFADGEARVVDHMYVMWNAYLANCVFHGNGLTDPLDPDGYVKLVAIGYDADGQEIPEHLEFFIAGAGGNIQTWTKWDLSPLGKVMMIEFNVAGDSDNGYGFSQPAYFCYDDVAVRFE